MAGRYLRCYAHGREDRWEAICIDLDIAVQGSSLNEVRQLLDVAVSSYVEDACKEDDATARRLLARRSPFRTRAKLGLSMLAYSLANRRAQGTESQTNFELPCHA